ncbi:MAG TPA: CaiB/BaiF CoA-transferase family protein [Blastocatellia bacterium]|nr:CaiB/BaiF CoA-transferase family protein [Blastocatellia bacterium]
MRPLDGITVLDLTRLLPGAVATMMLGDFGAEVIKIEEPGIGDPARQSRAGIKQPGAYFLATNRNKRGITINLKHERGRKIFLKLVEKADVVVEGFRPGVMDRLGAGYETLKSLNPRLIYCAITGYGQDGPYRLRAGHDANYLSVAGLLGVNGPKGGPPTLSGVQLADLAGGSLHAVIGVLLALQSRARTGEGQFVDISMTDTSLSMMYVPFASFLANDAQPERGNEGLSGRYACYQIYETKDGRYLSLGALEHKFWENACRALGREDFIGECFNDGAQEEIIAAFREIFKTRTAAEWLAAFENVDTCVALVNDIAEMIEDPQIKHRELIVEIEHPTEGRLKQIAPAVKLSATPGAIESPPPRLGEHTREILKSLDYADEMIESLASEGIVSL